MKKLKTKETNNGGVEIVWQGMRFIINGVENGIALIMLKDRPVVLSGGHPNLLSITGYGHIIKKGETK